MSITKRRKQNQKTSDVSPVKNAYSRTSTQLYRVEEKIAKKKSTQNKENDASESPTEKKLKRDINSNSPAKKPTRHILRSRPRLQESTNNEKRCQCEKRV